MNTELQFADAHPWYRVVVYHPNGVRVGQQFRVKAVSPGNAALKALLRKEMVCGTVTVVHCATDRRWDVHIETSWS